MGGRGTAKHGAVPPLGPASQLSYRVIEVRAVRKKCVHVGCK